MVSTRRWGRVVGLMVAATGLVAVSFGPASPHASAARHDTAPAASSSTRSTAPSSAPSVAAAGTERTADVALRYGSAGRSWSQEIRSPGSSYVKVHFAALKLVGNDRVTVASPDRREVHTYYADRSRGSDYTEHGDAGFAALSIDGDTAVVTLHATGARDADRLARRGYGVEIDTYFRGLDATERAVRAPSPKSVCGSDARRDVACYQTSHPVEYARGNAVARQLLRGTGHCTAWRVGNTNRMLTNQHCMESEADLRSSEFQFDYQCATCGGNNPRPGTKVSGQQLLKLSGLNALDYALFSVNSFEKIQQFGTLYLEPRTPKAGERIYIPGHGDTKPKRLSVYEESQGGATCKIDTVSSGVNTGYRCDTSGGNSGSPVLAASSHKVIALHHLGGCPNWGTRISLVYDQIKGDIDNNQPPQAAAR
ncbi:trypsin-like serine peptidase [Streptomyces zagrosensis]|uniref:Serine protease n=1 Tax=Streptomyces zagrosensis TaxID=1042984 RepID=A0A7W9QG96_9ACTN|nr:trypsin-like peptidase domain-containing protein [Streptomyces zagrosensis]MBB5939731.1 V8-like Glu-specific endopeptidase [Streptomyces zagrosensis]